MDAEEIARRCGVQELRAFQLQALGAVRAGRDVCVSVQTGGGKSLCYIGAATMFEAPVLVISPLKSLVADQLGWCAARRIAAVRLGDAVPPGACVVFTTPEAIAAGRLRGLAAPPAAVAVDEAHLIATWGASFRDSYAALGVVRSTWPLVPIMVLTATVSTETLGEVLRSLRVLDPVAIAGPAVRPNLAFSVLRADSPKDARAAAVRLVVDSPGKAIVYCRTKKLCDQLAAELADRQIDAAAYHSDLPDEHRADVLGKFLQSTRMVVVATVAFGLGVSVPDVRLVCNLGAPDSPDALWQQAGRAGRDGLGARCVLVTFPSDLNGTRDGMAAGGMRGDAAQQRAFDGVERMRAYLEMQSSCRQLELTRDFCQSEGPREPCGACDLCRAASGGAVALGAAAPSAVAAGDAERVAMVLQRTRGLGLKVLVDVLSGTRTPKATPLLHNRSSDWPRDRRAWEAAVRAALDAQLIRRRLVKMRSGFSVTILEAC